jgi:hypothetical protein
VNVINIKTHFLVGTPEAITPQSDFNEIKLHDQITFSENAPISALNQSYQKVVEIHQILRINKGLSNIQKLNFSSIGRYFIKQYLKDIVKKLE